METLEKCLTVGDILEAIKSVPPETPVFHQVIMAEYSIKGFKEFETFVRMEIYTPYFESAIPMDIAELESELEKLDSNKPIRYYNDKLVPITGHHIDTDKQIFYLY